VLTRPAGFRKSTLEKSRRAKGTKKKDEKQRLGKNSYQ